MVTQRMHFDHSDILGLTFTSELFYLQFRLRIVLQKQHLGMQRKEQALLQSESYSLDLHASEKADTADHDFLKVNFAERVWKTAKESIFRKNKRAPAKCQL